MKEAKRNDTFEPTGISTPSGNIKYRRHTVCPLSSMTKLQLLQFGCPIPCGAATHALGPQSAFRRSHSSGCAVPQLCKHQGQPIMSYRIICHVLRQFHARIVDRCTHGVCSCLCSRCSQTSTWAASPTTTSSPWTEASPTRYCL